MENIVLVLVLLFQLYFVLGILVSLFIQFKGLNKIDIGTENTKFWFRLIIFPGMVLLWPALVYKWIKTSK